MGGELATTWIRVKKVKKEMTELHFKAIDGQFAMLYDETPFRRVGDIVLCCVREPVYSLIATCCASGEAKYEIFVCSV